jgi:hypothetical protein
MSATYSPSDVSPAARHARQVLRDHYRQSHSNRVTGRHYGISYEYIRLILAGRHVPSAKLAKRIARIEERDSREQAAKNAVALATGEHCDSH